MKINKDKTKVMLFNTSKTRDFTPNLKIDGTEIEVVEELKILGVKVTSDLKWHEHIKYITKKGYTRIWILRRLKHNGASESELKDIYIKQIRSALEYACVVWHPGLTKVNTSDVERVQKTALAVILGKNYLNYQNGLENLKLEKLSARREVLSKKFADKAFKS